MRITPHGHSFEVESMPPSYGPEADALAQEQSVTVEAPTKALRLLERNPDIRGRAREAARTAILKRVQEQVVKRRPHWEARDLAKKRDALQQELLGPARLRPKRNGVPQILSAEEQSLHAARQAQIEGEIRAHLRSLSPLERESLLISAAQEDDTTFWNAIEGAPTGLGLFDAETLGPARRLHARVRNPERFREFEEIDHAIALMQMNAATTLRALEKLGVVLDDPIAQAAAGDTSALDPLRAQ